MRSVLPWLGLSCLLTLSAAAADPSRGEQTVVFATTHNGYRRAVQADGTPQPVTYTFGEGIYDGGSIVDHSLDHLQFKDLIKLLGAPLDRLGFKPGLDPKQVDQLIVVHWGRTTGWEHSGYASNFTAFKDAFSTPAITLPSDQGATNSAASPNARNQGQTSRTVSAVSQAQQMQAETMNAMQNEARDEADLQNARLLGYFEELNRLQDTQGALRDLRHGLLEEIEDDRYYVVLIAYDFPAMLQTKQRKVLWITRFSLRARGNQFDQNINEMIHAASRYFGRSSDGLKHAEIQQGHVTPGELKVLDYDEPKSK